MSKEEIIELITERIKSEHRKHKDIEWETIAAHKIYASLRKSVEGLVCPKCASEDVIWTYYCNQCEESM